MKNTLALTIAVAAAGLITNSGRADTLAIVGAPVSTSNEVRLQDFVSSVLGVSDDGTYVIGEVSGTSGYTVNEYLYNTKTGQTNYFAPSPSNTVIGTTYGIVSAISGNGVVVGGQGQYLGSNYFGDDVNTKTATIWSTSSLSTPPTQIGSGTLPLNTSTPTSFQIPFSTVTSLSYDGSAIIGYSTTQDLPGNRYMGFRYTAASGYIALPGLLSGSNSYSVLSTPVSTNGLGNIVVGDAPNASGQQAVLWKISGSAASPIVTTSMLPALSANTSQSDQGLVNQISSDGSTVVGQSLSASGLEVAVRWTTTDNWTTANVAALPLLPNEMTSYAASVSADGKLIVGSVTYTDYSSDGFIYNVATGQMELLSQLLSADGLASQLAGWTEMYIKGISADGSTLICTGLAPFSTRDGNNDVTQSFIVSLNGAAVPEPASLSLFGLGAIGILCRHRKV